jgi:hypothetical protein
MSITAQSRTGGAYGAKARICVSRKFCRTDVLLSPTDVIDKTAGGFDGQLGAWMPDDVVVHRVFSILDLPA